MKKFMVKVKTEDGIYNKFFDTWIEADNYRMDAECGMGWYAEVWQRVAGKYQFLYC